MEILITLAMELLTTLWNLILYFLCMGPGGNLAENLLGLVIAGLFILILNGLAIRAANKKGKT